MLQCCLEKFSTWPCATSELSPAARVLWLYMLAVILVCKPKFLVVDVQNPEAPGHSVIGCYLLDVHLVAFAVASR